MWGGTVLATGRGGSLSPSMSDLTTLRARLDALPLDRAPLHRAGLLTVLLVVLLVVTQAMRPEAPSASETLGRQDVHAEPERVSAPGGVSAGQVGAVLLLLTGGGLALWLRRRQPASGSTPTTALEVLETHPLGPNHSLRLVACGDEVLLLDVGAEGARLLRQWPRATFGTASTSAPPLEPVAVEAAPSEAAVMEVALSEATAPGPAGVTTCPEVAPAPPSPAVPHQFGPSSPSFADVLAQFAPARA